MTIEETIRMVDKYRPNQYDNERKVSWLEKLDGMVFNEVIRTHEGPFPPMFAGYRGAEPDTPLLIPFPYAEDIYNYYLQAMIDKENGEMQRYNQSISMFNTAYQTFTDWVNRSFQPRPRRTQFLF